MVVGTNIMVVNLNQFQVGYQNQPNRLTIKLASFGACFFRYIDEVEKVAEEEKKQVKPNKKNKSSSKN